MPYILRRDRVFFVADHDKFHKWALYRADLCVIATADVMSRLLSDFA